MQQYFLQGQTMGIPSGMELFIILGIVVLLFGGKKIPELMKGVGSGIKNFKNAVKEEDVVADVKPTETKQVETPTETVVEAKTEDTVKQA